ncbi:MAG: hypothetical protein E6240_01805 [Clostridium butyricum]|nr:hypothetical protein [Clostridium butyricum]
MKLSNFGQKLNKIDNNVYTIEEEITLIDGVYEADLEHYNVDPNSISVYTGSKLTGQQINTWSKSTPSLTPCRTHIKVYSTITPLYITYETIGDTVEADDVNNVQDAIIYTQTESNAENKKLTQDLDDEVQRAMLSEQTITTNLSNEVTRAKAAEQTITTNLNNEVTRAKKAESDETTRAKAAEGTITTNLSNEVTRATKVEGEITTNLNSEISRAKSAEGTLTTNLSNEVTRATKAEQAIQTTIDTNKSIWNDKYTKAEVDNKISQVISDIDWKESVATYNDIATTYPSPQDGWAVNVKDTDITYRYSGSKWIEISANSIPLATSSVDGKMSKTDKSFLDTVKSLWTNVTTHISDAVKHITSAERTLWNTVSNKAEKNHTHDTLVYYDLTGKTVDLNDYTINDGIVEHRFYRCRTIGGSANISNKPVADNPFVLEIECVRWSSATDFITKQTFTSAEIMCDYTRFYHSSVNAWTKWETNYNSKNLTKVSQLSNDAGYLTQADVDTSQNHIHTNKTTLDKITEDAWNDKLDKTGGTVTGRIICNGGLTVKSLNGGSGTAGYMHVARITIGSAYQNQPISFDIQQRNRYGSIILQFQSANSHDPDLSYIQKRGNIEAYMVKSSAGVWDLYVQKSEGYDVIEVIDMGKGEYMTLTTIEWKNVTVTTLPTGYITAGKQYIDMSVAKAEQDSYGNQINTTYVKKGTTWDELEGK